MSTPIENSMLEGLKLSLGWPKKVIAEDVNVQVKPGQITAIAGPNGAGKSTLVKTLATQLFPLEGQVRLGGADVFDMSAREFAQKVAYVPQSLEPGQHFTVLEMVMLGRYPHQPWWSWESTIQDRQIVERSLKKTETWELRQQRVSSLSGGERQRAMIAMALAQEPKFLILDEPTAHLDFRHQLELCDLLLELKGQGIGILIVLHDLNLISRLADNVVLLKKVNDSPSIALPAGSPGAVMQPDTLREVYGVDVSIIDDPSSGRTIYVPEKSASTTP